MKILLINSVCGVKSTGRICTDIATLLKENGDECKIAYGRETAEVLPCNTVKIGNQLSIKSDALLSRLFDNAGFNSKLATHRLIDEITRYKPDIVHIHNMHGYYLNIRILLEYLNKERIPTILSLYDCWTFTGHCSHFDYIGCDKWKMQCMDCPQMKEYPKSLFIDHSKRNYSRKKKLFTNCTNISLTVPSKWLSDKVNESFLSRFYISVVPNGIDLNSFSFVQSNIRETYHLQERKVILAVASDWNPMKGYSYLLRIATQLNDDCILVVIGVSDSQIAELPSNVVGIKRTNSKQELAEWYSSADVFINPTLQETQGLTNIEALACGLPVVTFASGGSVECIKSGCGIVVERGNIEQLINAIDYVLENKSLFIKTNIEKSVSIYDASTCNKRFLDLYREIYNKNN